MIRAGIPLIDRCGSELMDQVVEGDSVELPFGKVKIPAAKAEKVQGRGLLIAGLRPEHFEDAAVVDSDKADEHSTFEATVDVVEWLGNEAYAYVPFEAPDEVREQLTQLEKDLDGESLRTQLVVSLDGSSQISEGDKAKIWVDAAKMHLFDPATGENLTMDPENAGIVSDEDVTAKTEEAAEAQDTLK